MDRRRGAFAASVAISIAAAAAFMPALAPEPFSAAQDDVRRASAAAPRVVAARPTSSAVAPDDVVLTIPSSHPRLWYAAAQGSHGAARLTRARAYFAAHPPALDHWQTSTAMRNQALWSLLTDQSGAPTPSNPNPRGCAAAVPWMKSFDFPNADYARWSGEDAILIYDWCQAYMAIPDRAALIAAWNAKLAAFNDEWWGGPDMPANNYFWGYLRNSLLWGIASWHENPQAPAFVQEALDTRYLGKFLPWYASFGAGGVPLEGGQYGPYMFGYPVIAFAGAGDYGYDAWNATGFWRDAVHYLQYAATPAPTRAKDGAQALYEMFPFNDDQFFELGGSAGSGEYADLLGAVSLRNPASALAVRASEWTARTGTGASWWMRAELASLQIPASAPALPLDYYAVGAKSLYGRRSGAADATAFLLQMGNVSSGSGATGGVGHSHLDAGGFQLWRGGRWMSRETTGYGGTPSYYVRGLANVAGAPDTDVREAIAHNAVLFEGRGQVDAARGFSKVLRLQSAPEFAYAAVDLTDAYRAAVNEGWQAGDDWPFAERAIREFVYLRKLDALVVLDRLKSGGDSLDPIYDSCCRWGGSTPYYTGPQLQGKDVRKTFVIHAGGTGPDGRGNPFALGSGGAVATIGGSRMDVRTLLPAAPAYRIVDEGGSVGQFRLEYDLSGAEAGYFLNVIGLRGAADAPVSASLADQGPAWQVTLTHPLNGSATLLFQKGELSIGGSVRIDQAPAVALKTDRQAMTIDDNGPRWEGAPASPLRMTGGSLPPQRMPVSGASASPRARSSAAGAPGTRTQRKRRATYLLFDSCTALEGREYAYDPWPAFLRPLGANDVYAASFEPAPVRACRFQATTRAFAGGL